MEKPKSDYEMLSLEAYEYWLKEEKEYYYLTVKYDEYYSEKEYNYISDDVTVEVGDKVLVDMAGEIVMAVVIKAAYYKRNDVPFPVEKTKKIIKKVDENFDIDEIEFYDYVDYQSDDTPKMNIDGTFFEFGIFNYASNKGNDYNWATIKLNVHNRNFNYFVKTDLMTSMEIDELVFKVRNLLDGKLKEKEHIEFYQPDIEFLLYPKNNLYENETTDIYVELIINLTDKYGVYGGQKYVMILDRKGIEQLIEYTNKVVKN